MLYKIIKATRRFRILLGGYKKMEKKHRLFQLPYPLSPIQIYGKLLSHCYQYNTLSTTYKKQIFTVRKITDLDHQIHLRFYSDGWVSGHWEISPETSPINHLKGIDLRPLDEYETSNLKKQLGVD